MALAGAPRTLEGGAERRAEGTVCVGRRALGGPRVSSSSFLLRTTEACRHRRSSAVRLILTSVPRETRNKFPPALLWGDHAETWVGSFRSRPPLSIVVCTSQIFICIFFLNVTFRSPKVYFILLVRQRVSTIYVCDLWVSSLIQKWADVGFFFSPAL